MDAQRIDLTAHHLPLTPHRSPSLLAIERTPAAYPYLLIGLSQLRRGEAGERIARAMEQDPTIGFVVPVEGSATYLDSLAIPATAPHPELAHAFIDFTMEPEVAAEICRTIKYSSPNRSAWPLLPDSIRHNPAIFPSKDVWSRLELVEDPGEATVLYDRLWTEVKSR